MEHFVHSPRIIWSVKTRTTEFLCATFVFWIFLWVPGEISIRTLEFYKDKDYWHSKIDLCVFKSVSKKLCHSNVCKSLLLNSKSDVNLRKWNIQYTCCICNITFPVFQKLFKKSTNKLKYFVVFMNQTKHIFIWWIYRFFTLNGESDYISLNCFYVQMNFFFILAFFLLSIQKRINSCAHTNTEWKLTR